MSQLLSRKIPFSSNSLPAILFRWSALLLLFILLPYKFLPAQQDSVNHCLKYTSDTDIENSSSAAGIISASALPLGL